MKKSESQKSKTSGSQKTPSQLIDARIEELGDWRGKMLSRLRTVISLSVDSTPSSDFFGSQGRAIF